MQMDGNKNENQIVLRDNLVELQNLNNPNTFPYISI